MNANNVGTTPKRHHYVPKAYLKAFCDQRGRVLLYRKDAPTPALHLSPDNVAFHKYYYSQPKPEGGADDTALEKAFGVEEAKWPKIVNRICRRQDVNDVLENIFSFMSLQRVRVPAVRDAAEKMLADQVKATMRVLHARGKLLPVPPALNGLLDKIKVSIDPHQSIHAMVPMIRGMATVFDRLGVGALHNKTSVPFLTSDNPVIWFDPGVPDDRVQPYRLNSEGGAALIFPISPEVVIYGHSAMRSRFGEAGFEHGDIGDAGTVEQINRHICRFGYGAIFARDPGQEELIRQHSELSPVLRTQRVPAPNGEFVLHELVFGRRERKPKWGRRAEPTG